MNHDRDITDEQYHINQRFSLTILERQSYTISVIRRRRDRRVLHLLGPRFESACFPPFSFGFFSSLCPKQLLFLWKNQHRRP